MTVAELIQTTLELDQKAEVLFAKRNDSPYVYLVSNLPDGRRVACEMPTAVQKETNENTKEKTSE